MTQLDALKSRPRSKFHLDRGLVDGRIRCVNRNSRCNRHDIILMACRCAASVRIQVMFFFGLGMQGQVFELRAEHWLQSLGYLGEWCVGVALPISLWFGYDRGIPFIPGSDYGTAFLVAAGMLNILCILDVYDIALGRKP